MKTLKVTIKSNGPMMMHNGQLADPLNAYTKALKACTAKRKKDDDDQEDIAEAEFQGGLYHDPEIGPFIPGGMLDAMLTDGAKKRKMGKEFKAGVTVTEEEVQLKYKGPRERKALWADESFRDRRGVKVGQARVIRTRPVFKEWSLTFHIEIEDINPSEVAEALEIAGRKCGIGDYRPRFGKFSVESVKEI